MNQPHSPERNAAFGVSLPVMLMVVAAVVTAASLRPGATSIGPVLPEVTAGLGISPTTAGILTALPGLSFAFVGMSANWFTTWTGVVGSLVLASGLSTTGLLVRVLTDDGLVFIIMSAIALGGMAIGNVVLPAFIKSEFPRRAAQMATAYTTFLAVGSTLPIFVAPGLANMGDRMFGAGEGWRLALGAWTFVSAVALLTWLTLLFTQKRFRTVSDTNSKSTKAPSMWRSPTAVALMFFFGLQSMQAYIQFGWLPLALRDGGLTTGTAATLLAVVSLGGIPGGLLMPIVVARRRHLKKFVYGIGALQIIGYLGIGFAPTMAPWFWALSLSLAGFAFPTALALIIERTRNPEVTARVSGFAQPVGYLLAGGGPFLIGVLYELLGGWKIIMVLLAAMAIPQAIAGLVAIRPRYVDDHLDSYAAKAPRAYRHLPVEHLGVPASEADTFLQTILSGARTGASSLLTYCYKQTGGIPKVGAQRLVLDSEGVARAVIQIENVDLVRFAEVGADQLAAEGEGFDSATWREVQLKRWQDHGALSDEEKLDQDGSLDPRTEVVAERFRLVETL